MGGKGIGVRGLPGSIPGGTTTFDGVSLQWLERKNSEKVLGLTFRTWYTHAWEGVCIKAVLAFDNYNGITMHQEKSVSIVSHKNECVTRIC